MIKTVVDKWGRIDILVNNAGICQFKPFLDLTEEEWDRTLDINLKGYFLCAQAAAKEMAKQKSGTIVNIASVAMGQQGVGISNIVHYCASKGGVIAATRAIALEFAPLKITVNAIAPGPIQTPGVGEVDEKMLKQILQTIPAGRMGQPEDIAAAAVFLASDEAGFVTGAVLVSDGGSSIQ